MRSILAIVASLFPALASAQDARLKRDAVDATIDRGLGFLVKDALLWKKDQKLRLVSPRRPCDLFDA
jgi:hypothetical protein